MFQWCGDIVLKYARRYHGKCQRIDSNTVYLQLATLKQGITFTAATLFAVSFATFHCLLNKVSYYFQSFVVDPDRETTDCSRNRTRTSAIHFTTPVLGK